MQGRLTNNEECRFCEIVSDSIANHKVYEDEMSVAFLDKEPVFDGHVILIPREHIKNIYELSDHSIGKFFINLKNISKAVQTAMNVDGTFIAINTNVSQSVPHLHVHIVPRKYKDGLKGFFWPRHKYPNKEKANEICKAIKEELSRLKRNKDK